jgi:hypothetical protein
VSAESLTLVEAAPLLRRAHREHPEWWTYIYVIQAGEGGPVKIGRTVNPAERLKTLQQASAAPLIGVACWRGLAVEEKQLHTEYTHAHLRGEWFEPEPELLEFARRMGGDFEDWS